jgi:hypothetical protein
MVMDLERANEQIVSLECENRILREENALLKQGMFGRRTERMDPGQLELYLRGAVLDSSPQPIEAAPSAASTPQPTQTNRGHGRARFPEHGACFEMKLVKRCTRNKGRRPLSAIGIQDSEFETPLWGDTHAKALHDRSV